jgi:hypothetical protein
VEGVCFRLVQPELPLLPSSSFCQSESRNLCILTCSIFRNLDDVVHLSIGVVYHNCKLEITPSFFFFSMPVHIWVALFSGRLYPTMSFSLSGIQAPHPSFHVILGRGRI